MVASSPTGRGKSRGWSTTPTPRSTFVRQNADVPPRQEAGFDSLDVLAFAAELVLWSACGVAAHRLAGGGIAGLVVSVLTILFVIVAWSFVMAPRAPRRLAVTGRNLVVLVLGGIATTVLAMINAPAWAGSAAVSTLALVVADRTRRTTRSLG